MPPANIIQLRQLLADKFPGMRTRLAEVPAARADLWPTGLPQIDESLGGGLPRGGLVEIVSGQRSCGSASVLRALLQQAASENRIITLIDGSDSLDVASLDASLRSRLLWVRCRSADEALKAADLLLRDGNLSLVLIDLAFNQPAQLRRVPASTWYRFQRLVEETAILCAVFTPHTLVGPAEGRVTLFSDFPLATLELEGNAWQAELQLEASRERQFQIAGRSLS
jgi:hypothetical protein